MDIPVVFPIVAQGAEAADDGAVGVFFRPFEEAGAVVEFHEPFPVVGINHHVCILPELVFGELKHPGYQYAELLRCLEESELS